MSLDDAMVVDNHDNRRLVRQSSPWPRGSGRREEADGVVRLEPPHAPATPYSPRNDDPPIGMRAGAREHDGDRFRMRWIERSGRFAVPGSGGEDHRAHVRRMRKHRTCRRAGESRSRATRDRSQHRPRRRRDGRGRQAPALARQPDVAGERPRSRSVGARSHGLRIGLTALRNLGRAAGGDDRACAARGSSSGRQDPRGACTGVWLKRRRGPRLRFATCARVGAARRHLGRPRSPCRLDRTEVPPDGRRFHRTGTHPRRHEQTPRPHRRTPVPCRRARADRDVQGGRALAPVRRDGSHVGP